MASRGGTVSPTVRQIKIAQKEALLLREISRYFLQICLDEPTLCGLTINRVKLTDDKGICVVYFYTPDGTESFRSLMPRLILYKPSIRKAIAHAVPGRYTPEIQFRFDEQFDKQQRLEGLLEQVKREDLS